MDVRQLCGAIRERVQADLQVVADPRQRGEVLIGALYELSRSVFPALGPPRQSLHYLERQGVVLELISFLAIPLIRGRLQAERAVSVLSELAEGCPDPLLRKKLSVYAQELLAKSSPRPRRRLFQEDGWVPWFLVVCAGATVVLPFALSLLSGEREAALVTAVAPAPHKIAHKASSLSRSAPNAAAEEAEEPEQDEGEAPAAAQPAGEARPLAPLGERVIRVRVVRNQVLVPVILRNGGESVRVELILDTGASRTVVHEGLAERLHIDLRAARPSQSEVADGRLITSRLARIDSLAVGPIVTSSAELELIPYRGSEGFHDGLLGMDFLSKHRYQLDMERQLIRWY